MPLTGTLFRGPGVQYDNNGFTLSSCALGVACADLRFENKARRGRGSRKMQRIGVH